MDFIRKERSKQLKKWPLEHDMGHLSGELTIQAAVCAVNGTNAIVADPLERGPRFDVWGLLKKHGYDGENPNRVKLLSIAGALIAAEIDKELVEMGDS